MSRFAAAAAAAAVLCLALAASPCFAQCAGQRLRTISDNPGERGPWPVGLRSMWLTERNMSVDVLYPAVPGSEAGQQYIQVSIRDNYMPPRQAAKIPDDQDPVQVIEAYRDLPLDTLFGPYPVHIHIHGTAAFKSASAHQLTHMASRGFVVVGTLVAGTFSRGSTTRPPAAADHPGLYLMDMMRLGNGNEVDLPGDFYRTLAELNQLTSPDLAFLRNHINTTLLAASGHSAGGSGVAALGDVAQVIMPMSARGVRQGPALKSVLALAGELDGIISYEASSTGYSTSPSPKRMVGVARAGHLFCTDLCWIGEEQGGLVQIAIDNGIYLAYLFKGLGTDGCGADNVNNFDAWPAINYAMSAAQEEILHCKPRMADALRNIASATPNVLEYKEDL